VKFAELRYMDILSALADIAAYLNNDKDIDPLIKAALVHYQFETIHPFEQYNGVVGRIVISIILQSFDIEVMPLICLSEYFITIKMNILIC